MILESFQQVFSPAWMDAPGVKCKGNNAYFYPNKPSTAVAQAKMVCNGTAEVSACVHRLECLHHAIDHHEIFGVWGGTSERERRKIQQARKRYRNPYIYDLEGVRFPGVTRVQRRSIVRVNRLRPLA